MMSLLIFLYIIELAFLCLLTFTFVLQHQTKR